MCIYARVAIVSSLLILACPLAAEPLERIRDFETRYVLARGVGEKELAKNWRPVWKIEASADGSSFEMSGDENGNAIGAVYYGAVFAIPASVPRTVAVSFECQAFCASENRVPALGLEMLTLKGWQKLGESPDADVPYGRLTGGDKLFGQAFFGPVGDDATEWTSVTSRSIASAMRASRDGKMVVAIKMSTVHASSEEWVKLRNIRLETDTRPLAPTKREQRWPLKENRTLHTDEEIAIARQNCEEHESAEALRKGILAAAERWVALSDEEVLRRVPGADVPRAGNVHAEGCPVHGNEVYEGGSCYPWKLDWNKPLTITCPVGGEVYPTNDFYGTYTDPNKTFGDELKQDYADDGWGWIAPNGERYWLVGYACHWWWRNFVLPGVLNLSRAYVLTGEEKYAHKAALMLDKIATHYPDMDYESQSRYGSLTAGAYNGKILNLIWETFVLTDLAEAYDSIFPAIDADAELQRALGKSGEEIRANIETNLLQEGIDCVFSAHIRGNFGMHQSALITASVVREKGPTDEHIDWLMMNPGGSWSNEGMKYALYNFIYRDGMPFETSPGYCNLWVSKFTLMAEVLKKAGADFYENTKLKKMYDAPLEMISAGTQTPAEGDSGGWKGGRLGVDPNVYLPALREYQDPRYAAWLNQRSFDEKGGFLRYELLFGRTPTGMVQDALADYGVPTPVSRLLPGYGMAILNNRADDLAAAMYYGWKGGHGHWDSLNLHFFDTRGPLMPDTGYPDFMNAFIPGIFTWSKTTIAHNTATVDAKRQFGNTRGRLMEFISDGPLHLVTVDNPGVYPEIVERYMRTLLLVETGDSSGYLVDVFRISGGEQHDYSLHAGPGEFTILAGKFSEPRAKGTLAGPDVEIGQFYDDAVLGAPDYHGSFGGYAGSGFQHLFNVQEQQAGGGDVAVEWRPSHPDTTRTLRLHLTGQPGQQAILADAQISPVKYKHLLKYVIGRRAGDDLQSAYASVIEPYPSDGSPQVVSARRVDTANEAGVALHIERPEGSDIIYHSPASGTEVKLPGDVSFDGRFCFYHLGEAGGVSSVYAVGGTFSVKGEVQAQDETITGRVEAVDPDNETITVALHDAPADVPSLSGRTLLIENDDASFPYRITSAEQAEAGVVLHIAGQVMKSGYCRLAEYDAAETRLTSDSYMPFAGVYVGATVANEGLSSFYRVVEASTNGCRIEPGDTDPAAALQDADGDGIVNYWILDGGPGDRVRIDIAAHLPEQ